MNKLRYRTPVIGRERLNQSPIGWPYLAPSIDAGRPGLPSRVGTEHRTIAQMIQAYNRQNENIDTRKKMKCAVRTG